MKSRQLLWLSSAFFLMVIGCFNVAPDVNRVGGNYSQKKQFDGEWYYRPTIVDKQYNNASMFIGSECDLDRVKFEITENVLRAYRSYEKVGGTEGANHGQQTLVAAFPILKHFDIKRDYNPANGIESNLVIENDFDRPWWERDYIRVDWSRNLIPDVSCNDWIKTSAMQQIPRNSANNRREPFRVRLTENYMETTVEALARPQKTICNYIGDWNCTGAQVKLKFSFQKIMPSTYEKMLYPDYLPLEYGETKDKKLCIKGNDDCNNLRSLWLQHGPDGSTICQPSHHNIDDCKQYEVPVFSRFGYFRTERQRFDRENGFTLSGREQYINRWNIWKETRYPDGTSMPVRDRIPKPIIYYLNAQFPMELYEASQTIADSWSLAINETVAQLKSNCSIEEYNNYVDKFGLKKEMASLRYAHVTEANITDACFQLSEVSQARQLRPLFFSGDHRQINKIYGKMFQILVNDCNIANVNNYVAENKLERSLTDNGIENITLGNIEEVCAILEFVSEKNKLAKKFSWQQLGDLRYSFLNYSMKAELAGPLGYGPSSADPLTGEIVSANANIYGASIDTYAAWGADIVQLLNGEISDVDLMNGTQIRDDLAQARHRFAQPVSSNDVDRFAQLFDDRTKHLADAEYLVKLPLASLNQNWNILKKSGIEEKYLVTDEMVRLFSLEQIVPSAWATSATPSFEQVLGKGPVDSMNADMLSTFNQKVDFFGRRSACFLMETLDPAIAELASRFVGKSRQEAYQFIRANVLIAVASHEIGHTLGLRHNFEASTDALNYFPAFWGVDTGDHRMSKASNRTSEMRYSSIMDYHQRINSDFAGLGLYDKAAIKFGYGSLIEVFDESDGNFVPHQWNENVGMFHYKDLPYFYSGEDVDDKLSAHYRQIRDQSRSGDNSAKINIQKLGLTPQPENMFRRKNIPFADFYKSLFPRLFSSGNKAVSYFEVPYKYCSDAYASGGSITCNRWDMGASAEEIVDNAAELYESYYVFNSFRGDKINFSPSSYMSKLYQRTYQPMLAPFRYLYYYRRSSSKIWPVMQDYSAAAYKGINFFGRVLQTVEPGRYCLTAGNLYVPEKDVVTCQGGIDIKLGQGRYYNTHFSGDFNFKPNNIGHMYDKLLAMQALTDSASFTTRDFSVSLNRGAFSIGYYRVFGSEMINLFTGMLKDDVFSYSPELILDNQKPVIRYRELISLNAQQANNVAPRIKASNSWVMRYYSMVFPMINYTSNVDRQLDYAKRARITLVGSRHDPVIDPSVPQLIFMDPSTKVQYRSLASDGESLAPGYQLLKEAKLLTNDGSDGMALGRWYQAHDELEKSKTGMEQATITKDAGAIKTAREIHEKNKVNMRAMNNELYQHMQVIDLMRYLGDLLDYGG
jgi:Met-zincin